MGENTLSKCADDKLLTNVRVYSTHLLEYPTTNANLLHMINSGLNYTSLTYHFVYL